MVDARSATAADFDRAAQRHANTFWFCLVVAGVVWWFAGWWAAIPGAVAVWCAVSSIGATRAGMHLRRGTYKVWNPNNGAPDGDAANRDAAEA